MGLFIQWACVLSELFSILRQLFGSLLPFIPFFFLFLPSPPQWAMEKLKVNPLCLTLFLFHQNASWFVCFCFFFFKFWWIFFSARCSLMFPLRYTPLQINQFKLINTSWFTHGSHINKEVIFIVQIWQRKIEKLMLHNVQILWYFFFFLESSSCGCFVENEKGGRLQEQCKMFCYQLGQWELSEDVCIVSWLGFLFTIVAVKVTTVFFFYIKITVSKLLQFSDFWQEVLFSLSQVSELSKLLWNYHFNLEKLHTVALNSDLFFISFLFWFLMLKVSCLQLHSRLD